MSVVWSERVCDVLICCSHEYNPYSHTVRTVTAVSVSAHASGSDLEVGKHLLSYYINKVCGWVGKQINRSWKFTILHLQYIYFLTTSNLIVQYTHVQCRNGTVRTMLAPVYRSDTQVIRIQFCICYQHKS